ncbi:hypothetical protein ACFYPT_41570 [Streptomyces sp. NPDC005529]|uniref:hypothetical protein n=1 Tax=unclassified Streptomyces TaxID=2593676 RepID=UPI0033AD08D3
MMLSGSLTLFAAGSSGAADFNTGGTGSTVVYSDGTYLYRVHVNFDGSHDTAVQLKDGDGSPIQGTDPSVSPDGNLVAFRSGVTGGTAGVAASAGSTGTLSLLPVAGGTNPFTFGSANVMSAPTWNPTRGDSASEQLAYVVKHASDNGGDIYKINVSSSGGTVLSISGNTKVMPITTAVEGAISTGDDNAAGFTLQSLPSTAYRPHNSQLSWSPDGAKLALTGYDNGLQTIKCSNDEASGGYTNNLDNFSLGTDCRVDSWLYTINSDGTGLALIHRGLGDANPSWNSQGYAVFTSYGKENTQTSAVGPIDGTPGVFAARYRPSDPDGNHWRDGCTYTLGGQYFIGNSPWSWNLLSAGKERALDQYDTNCPDATASVLKANNVPLGGHAAAHLWSTLPVTGGAGLYGNASPSPLPHQGQTNLGLKARLFGTYAQTFQQWSYTDDWYLDYENPSVSADGSLIAVSVGDTLRLGTLNSGDGLSDGLVNTGLNAKGGVALSSNKLDGVVRNADGSWQSWQGVPQGSINFAGAPSKVAVAGTTTGSAEAVTRGPDNNFYYTDHSGGLWNNWSPVPGIGYPYFAGSSIGIAKHGGYSAIAAVGTTGQVYYNTHNPSSDAWGSWQQLSSTFSAVRTAVAVDANGVTYVMATDSNDFAYLNTLSGTTWSGWQQLSRPTGYGFNQDIAIAGNGNGSGAQLVAIDNNRAVWHNLLSGPGGTFTGWAKPAQIAGGTSTIAAVGMDNGDVQFVGVGMNRKLFHDVRYANGSWSGWGQPAGMNGAANFQANQAGIANIGGGNAYIMATTG